jgi:hypothetical protein
MRSELILKRRGFYKGMNIRWETWGAFGEAAWHRAQHLFMASVLYQVRKMSSSMHILNVFLLCYCNVM